MTIAATIELGGTGAASLGEPPTDIAAFDNLTLTVTENLAEVETLWRAFEAIAVMTAFQSFDWLARWMRHVGVLLNGTGAVVLGFGPEENLLFILPFFVEERGPVRHLAWLGSDLCDYNAGLFAPGFAAAATPERLRRLWTRVVHLLQSRPTTRFDLFNLEKIPAAVDGTPNPLMALLPKPNANSAYAATLGSDWPSFYEAKRSSSTRKTERKQLRRLGEHGAIRFVTPEAADERAGTLDRRIAQKRRAFARMGVDDIFSLPGHAEFYRDVASDPALAPLVQVARLEVGAETAAASVALTHRGCRYLILSSYDDGPLSQFGPGRAHLHALMQNAIEARAARFDFTIGDEPYKHDWCDVTIELYDYVRPARARGVPVALASTLLRSAKRFIKQTPAVWQAFTRLRAETAALLRRNPFRRD